MPFLFIIGNWNEFEEFFEKNLYCNLYQRRKWLAVILDCKEAHIVKAIDGKLNQIDILNRENYRGRIELKQVFMQKLQDLSPDEFRTQFSKLVKYDPVPLD